MQHPFDELCSELQKVSPFKIKYKDESWEMQLLNIFVLWFNPRFMTGFTTVIGNTIYFPSRHYIEHYPMSAMRTLAHEAVHLMDSDHHGVVSFSVGYLFPQILALGVIAYPVIGWLALIFLVFLLPLPAPFRAYFESRAYAIDLLTADPGTEAATMDRIVNFFTNWDYYRMMPDKEKAKEQLEFWIKKAESGEDPILLKVLLVYEMIADR